MDAMERAGGGEDYYTRQGTEQGQRMQTGCGRGVKLGGNWGVVEHGCDLPIDAERNGTGKNDDPQRSVNACIQHYRGSRGGAEDQISSTEVVVGWVDSYEPL